MFSKFKYERKNKNGNDTDQLEYMIISNNPRVMLYSHPSQWEQKIRKLCRQLNPRNQLCLGFFFKKTYNMGILYFHVHIQGNNFAKLETNTHIQIEDDNILVHILLTLLLVCNPSTAFKFQCPQFIFICRCLLDHGYSLNTEKSVQ